MTKSIVVFTDKKTGEEAGIALGTQIRERMEGENPNVVIVFASSVYDYHDILRNIKKLSNPDIIVGSSSAGEFTSIDFGTESACAIALHSNEMKFSAGLGVGIKESREAVVDELFSNLQGTEDF